MAVRDQRFGTPHTVIQGIIIKVGETKEGKSSPPKPWRELILRLCQMDYHGIKSFPEIKICLFGKMYHRCKGLKIGDIILVDAEIKWNQSKKEGAQWWPDFSVKEIRRVIPIKDRPIDKENEIEDILHASLDEVARLEMIRRSQERQNEKDEQPRGYQANKTNNYAKQPSSSDKSDDEDAPF